MPNHEALTPESLEQIVEGLKSFIIDTAKTPRTKEDFIQRTEIIASSFDTLGDELPKALTLMQQGLEVRWHGKHKYLMLLAPAVERIYPMAAFEITEPNEPLNEKHSHTENSLESSIAIEGLFGVLTDDPQPILLEPFNSYFIRGAIPHTSHNPGDTISVALVIRGQIPQEAV